MTPFRQLAPALLALVLALAPVTAMLQARTAVRQVQPEVRQIRTTVLFFNDLHGHLQPFRVTRPDGTSVEVGGIAGIAALVKDIREENRQRGIRTLLLVAGDVLQGTPMSTVFQGKPDIEIFNAMGVDAMTVGNHELDFGLENYLRLQQLARFPFLSSNMVWKDSRRLMNGPSMRFPLGQGVWLTVVGATTRELLETTAPANVEKVDVLDSVKTVSEAFRRGRSHGPVILLSHSRFQTDAEIARTNPGLTAIIGGHDQVLFDPAKYAAGVPVFQAFEKGRFLGRLDLVSDPKTKATRVETWSYIPITPALKQDPAVLKILDAYQSRLSASFKEVVGEALVFLDGERGRIRYEETGLGNFVTDIMRTHTGSDIALLNAGSLRASLEKGPITLEAIFKVMPYPNEVLVTRLSGAELLEVLGRSVRGAREDEDGGFLHVSGLRMKARGRKVAEVSVGGAPLDPARSYTVTLTDFMHTGGDGYRIFIGKAATNTRLPLRELLVDTIRKQGKVGAKVEGRLIRE